MQVGKNVCSAPCWYADAYWGMCNMGCYNHGVTSVRQGVTPPQRREKSEKE